MNMTAKKNEKTTEDVIKEMLLENTGAHPLDSGGAYGRNWQHNQGQDFDKAPEVNLVFEDEWIDLTINVYHWLVNRVEYDPKMQARFDMFAKSNSDTHWLELMENFPKWLARTAKKRVQGLYGEGEPFFINTYNDDCLLSQTLQMIIFSYDDTLYAAIQIHGGCDIRGGYTAPKLFRVDDNILSWNDVSIWCNHRVEDNVIVLPGCESYINRSNHGWDSDDGYHFKYNDCTANERPISDLDKYDIKRIESEKDIVTGVICVTPDKVGHCPICGCKLSASFS
jgi:hypothetical protein